MEIKPKIGIDNIYLGMTMAEVRSLWGDPEDISTFIPLEEKPEDRIIEWNYSNGIELNFDSDDNFLLASINCESKSATFQGLSVVGITPKELILRLPGTKLDDEFELAIDEYRNEEFSLSFWAQYGKIYAVSINPEYDESGNEVIWPIRNN
ncbi:hypothetical protein O5O45_12585 [Hahella aquimaris]|uniref:hypothetical protein n=1 Tax=Hahella sp. HNIBRBA332 TaxID=3015983 RepID=UPI00273A9205|nr:hypothetical protein [Hahella sp. HNIBRBA332]WLQ16755.1 hypothetical protein O5O45_12585 [Hahella sp. HNIBRBA332]